MLVPKGNILIEDVELSADSIEEMLRNLEQEQFTGYSKFDLGESSCYIFFSGGGMTRALEVNIGSGATSVHLVPRMVNRLRERDVKVSSYVTSPAIVSVLSGVFAFKPQFLDYKVNKRELKKVLDDLQSTKASGVIKISSREGTDFLLVGRGELVTDRFCQRYGEILCGTEAVRERLESVSKNGATINVYAEKADEIENRYRQKEDELEKIKQLVAKQDGGFLRAGDVVKVDEYAVREWGMDAKATFNVELETSTGDLYEYKCQAARKMGSYAGLAPAMLKHMGIREGELLSIRPL